MSARVDAHSMYVYVNTCVCVCVCVMTHTDQEDWNTWKAKLAYVVKGGGLAVMVS